MYHMHIHDNNIFLINQYTANIFLASLIADIGRFDLDSLHYLDIPASKRGALWTAKSHPQDYSEPI